jgi:hypothetical protein
MNILLLLGTGFFKTPRADNTDSIIKQWIVNHPDAIVISCIHVWANNEC